MSKTKLVIQVFLAGSCSLLMLLSSAQSFRRTAVTNYNVDNGLLQNSVTHVVTDKFGFVWFSTGAGVQRFDGSRFETMPIDGSGNTAFRSANLALLSNEEIWISNAAGITAFNPATNRSRRIYGKPTPLRNFFYEYGAEDGNAVWFLAYPEAFLCFDKTTGALLHRVPLPSLGALAYTTVSCRQMGAENIVIRLPQSLAVFSLRQKKIVLQHHVAGDISGLVPLSANILLYTSNGIYYKLNIATGKAEAVHPAEDHATAVTAFQLLLTPQGRLLAGYDQNVYELDTATLNIKTKWAALNQENLLNSGYITSTYLDRFQRLWVLTNSDGVKKINLDQPPFDYYGTADRKTNFVRSIFVNKSKGLLMAGTYEQGLLLFDTSGYLRKHLLFQGTGSKTITDMMPVAGDDYLFLMMGDTAFYQFNAKTSTLSPLYLNKHTRLTLHCSYYGTLHPLPGNRFLFLDRHFFSFRVVNGKITDTATLRPNSSYLYNLCSLQSGGYCIASNLGLEFTDTAFRQQRFVRFAQPIFPRCLAQDREGNLWMGTETGLYKLNSEGAQLKKFTLADGLADEGIYAIEPVAGGIYFSHNKGLSFLSSNGRFVHYTRQAGLQENEFNTKASFHTADGKLFFGGINGITAFYPQQVMVQGERPPVSITELRVMDKPWRDTAVWNIQKIALPYDAARLALRVGVPASHAAHVYEYKMENLEPVWNTTSGVDFIRYALAPGDYVFRVRISNGKDRGTYETRLLISVAAPYWQTAWFRVGAGLLLLGTIAFAFHRYHRNKYRRKIKRLEMEHKLQGERERISRDLHDHIGAYASAIADNADKIAKDPADEARLRSLKESAKEIMHNLRDTIWALNKKEISAITLSDRIKAYLQKMRDAYPALKIQLEENVTAQALLSPELALNVLRIVQEALHNAIKHSRSSEIVIVLQIGSTLAVSVRDKGIGLSPSPIGDGNGLRNMQARAKEANLQLRIVSSKEKGTSVELFSPLQ